MEEKLLCPNCHSANLRIERRLYAAATRYQPEEWLYRGVCEDCGEVTAYDDLEVDERADARKGE